MRLVLISILAALTVPATQPPVVVLREAAQTSPRDCNDRIERVRADLGQPVLRRDPADPDRPYLIAAVDKRVDGCAVMQMRGDLNDLRPLPAPHEGPPRLEPAR